MFGGMGPNQLTKNNCYTFNIHTNSLAPKENMIHPRDTHGFQKMAQKIFVFGGFDTNDDPSKSAEIYDVVNNSWKELPDMPTGGSRITCVRVQNQILISSINFRLMSYDVENEDYSYLGSHCYDFLDRCIVSSKKKLYLFEKDKIFEMNTQCEVLDTITTDIRFDHCQQKFTNKQGRIFLLDSLGKVYCFNPFGEKQPREVKDLH